VSVVAAAVILLAAVLPAVASPYGVFVLAIALVYGLLAISLDLQWGYSGLINFGPAGYFGVGAYAYALLGTRAGVVSVYLLLPAAMAAGALAAVVISWPAFRARTLPMYYALLTLSAALLLGQYVSIAYGVTNGTNGINTIPPLDFSIPGVLHWTAFSQTGAYYVVLVLVAVVFLLLLWMVSSAFGRAVRAIREDEVKCETLGYPVRRWKLIMAMAGGAVGALAGALFAGVNGSIDPGVFGVALSVQVFIWVALGGQGTLWGPLLAAVLLTEAESYLSEVTTDLYLIIIAALFVLAVIFLPTGIAGALRTLGGRGRELLGRPRSASTTPSRG
jgi:branched-chain amino acid transport system permease protein